MHFFRSEETLRDQQETGSGGEALGLPQIWALSLRWYHNRSRPTFAAAACRRSRPSSGRWG